MLCVMAIQAQQLPVAAIGGIVVVIAIPVMHGEHPEICTGEAATATSADVCKELESLFAIPLVACFSCAAGLRDEAIELGRVTRNGHDVGLSGTHCSMPARRMAVPAPCLFDHFLGFSQRYSTTYAYGVAVNLESFDTPIACPFHHFTGYCNLKYRLASVKKAQPVAFRRYGNFAASARIEGTLAVA